MTDKPEKDPDHTLLGSDIEDDGEPPKVYAVTDLRPYLTPDMEEELGAAPGDSASCGSEVVCTCVPVATCACDTVTYHVGTDFCSPYCTTCTCTSTSHYWHPN